MRWREASEGAAMLVECGSVLPLNPPGYIKLVFKVASIGVSFSGGENSGEKFEPKLNSN